MHRAVPPLLLAAGLAAVGGLLAWDLSSPAGDGTFPVTVRTPQEELFDGTVQLRAATAYSALEAAAAAGGFDVEATGRGDRLFVVRVGDYANAGEAGWCYAVWEGRWVRPDHSAGIAGLADGQAVLWEYARDGCPSG